MPRNPVRSIVGEREYPPLSEEDLKDREQYEDDRGDHICDLMMERDEGL